MKKKTHSQSQPEKSRLDKNVQTYKVPFRSRHPVLYFSFWLIATMSLLVGFLATIYVSKVIDETPVITEQMLKSDGSTNMYDKDGQLIYSDTDITRDYVKRENIPDLYVDLLLSTEDADFYDNPGFSYKGLANAAISVVKEKLGKGESRGGSTIDQQLIKNVAFSSDLKDRTIDRKIKELWLSRQMYENFEKDEILEWYVNKISMGENSYGAETVSITYFNKKLSDLAEYTPENISKLAIIAGLGQAPGQYNLYDNPDLVQKRRDTVLYLAVQNGALSQAQADAAKQVDVTLDLQERYWRNAKALEQTKRHSSFVDSALRQVKEMGYDIEKTPMQITTTLDPAQNDWLTAEVNKVHHYKDDGQQVAVTVIDNETRSVIAQSGGRHVTEPLGLNRAEQSTRSSGSTIKPFLDFGPAIEYLGYGTNFTLDSGPYTYPGTNLTATNYGGASYGMVTMQQALRQSLNTPSIRLLDEHVGHEKASMFMHNLGFTNKDVYAGGDALGIDSSARQLAGAFSALANDGVYSRPNYIKSLEFSDGSVLNVEPEPIRAMSPSTAFILLKMLDGVTLDDQIGTANDAKIPEFKGYATKTGTVAYDMSTQKYWRPQYAASDSAIGGTTRSISVGIWTGYDEPNSENGWIDERQANKQTLYTTIMRHFNQGRDTSAWDQPDNVAQSGSGLHAHYTPIEKEIYPNIIVNAIKSGKTFEEFKALNPDSIEIKNNGVSEEKPKDYKINEWVNSLNSEDKSLYQRWVNGEDISQVDLTESFLDEHKAFK